eukprot:Skav208868  [mRNA]  locus=scaffold6901:110778:122808:+ [translate_table: standard]
MLRRERGLIWSGEGNHTDFDGQSTSFLLLSNEWHWLTLVDRVLVCAVMELLLVVGLVKPVGLRTPIPSRIVQGIGYQQLLTWNPNWDSLKSLVGTIMITPSPSYLSPPRRCLEKPKCDSSASLPRASGLCLGIYASQLDAGLRWPDQAPTFLTVRMAQLQFDVAYDGSACNMRFWEPYEQFGVEALRHGLATCYSEPIIQAGIGHRSSNASLSDKGRLRLQALGSNTSMGSGRSAPCCHVSPEELKGSQASYRDGITTEESGLSTQSPGSPELTMKGEVSVKGEGEQHRCW